MELRVGAVKEPVICHICDFQPEYGGSFVESLIHLNRHCSDNLKVRMFCIFPNNARSRNWLKNLDEEGIRYGFIPSQRNVMRHIRSLLEQYDPVVLHTHFFFFDLSAILIKLLTYRKSKIVWHYHNPVEFNLKQRIKNAFKISALFNCFGDCCIAVGDGVYQSMRSAGFAPHKTRLIYNGVNISRFLNKCEVDVQQDLAIPRGEIVFLLLGWDPVRKGVDVFLTAAEEMACKGYKNCRFLVVGRAETRRYVGQLLGEASLWGDTIRVVDPVEDFAALLKGVDVFVSASRSEGLTYAVLESMAGAKAVLSSDIPAVRETYGRSKGVWLFRSGDWKTLAELMEKFVSLDFGERRLLGEANSQYVVENHSLDQWSERVGQVYKELLGRKQLPIEKFI